MQCSQNDEVLKISFNSHSATESFFALDVSHCDLVGQVAKFQWFSQFVYGHNINIMWNWKNAKNFFVFF